MRGFILGVIAGAAVASVGAAMTLGNGSALARPDCAKDPTGDYTCTLPALPTGSSYSYTIDVPSLDLTCDYLAGVPGEAPEGFGCDRLSLYSTHGMFATR